MRKIQPMKNFFKKFLLTALIIVLSVLETYAQEATLGQADSLFVNKKYTEAFKEYEKIFSEGKASPAMLTRMAFIKEGLGNYAEALYYLNLYYQHTSDKGALVKMREIAEAHNLYGYEYSDFKFFLTFLQKYLPQIIFSLLAFSVFLLAYSYSRRRKNETPITATVLQVVVILLIGTLINGFIFEQSAIIARDNVVLMSGPSAGAEPVQVIARGHRVEVLKEGPVWNRILWEDKPVYIRSKNLKTL